MTKQVAFSDAAYAALRQEKGSAESFSDLALRLLREARIAKKDPMRFVNFPHRRLISAEEHLREIEWGREHDRPDPWQEEAARKD